MNMTVTGNIIITKTEGCVCLCVAMMMLLRNVMSELRLVGGCKDGGRCEGQFEDEEGRALLEMRVETPGEVLLKLRMGIRMDQGLFE